MTRIKAIDKNYTVDKVLDLLRSGKIVELPFMLNDNVFVINNGKPQKKLVTDISWNGITLNGVFTTWEDIEAQGGIYESEFGALSAIGSRK